MVQIVKSNSNNERGDRGSKSSGEKNDRMNFDNEEGGDKMPSGEMPSDFNGKEMPSFNQ